MKYYSLIAISLLMPCLINCQSIANYRPLRFDNLEPIWAHPICDSSIIGHKIDHPNIKFGFDGYSHLWSSQQRNIDVPIIEDGYLYNVYKTIYRNDLSGAIIEKIDLETGLTVWKTTFDGRDSVRETVEKVVLKSDTLIFYNIRVTTPEHPFPLLPALAWGIGNAGGVLAVRKYDKNTGALIDYQTADEGSSNVKFLKPYAGNRNLIEPISSDLLLSINHEIRTTGQLGSFVIIDTLNYSGEYVNGTDTIFSEFEVDWSKVAVTNNYKFMYDNVSDCIYWIDYYNLDNGNNIETKVTLRNVSNGNSIRYDLNFIKENEFYYFGIVAISNNYILLYADSRNEDDGNYFLIDKSGNLINKINVDGILEMDTYIEIDNNGDFIFGHNTGEPGSLGYEVYRSDGDQLIKTVLWNSSEPYYDSYHHKAVRLDNGDFLFYITQFDDSPGVTQPGRFYTIIKVNPSMIGLSSSFDKAENLVSIFPNPTSGMLTVEGIDFTKIEIFNEEGKVIANEESTTIDLTNHPNGLYLLRIHKKDGTIQTEKVVKI